MSQTPVNGLAGYPPSPYILNILELQNTVTNVSGLNPINVISNAVNNIQQMVNFDQKRIYVNTISKYDQTPIQVTDDINLSNANLYINGSEVTSFGGGSGSAGTYISTAGGNGIYVQSTSTSNATAIGFQVAGRTVFSIDGAGRALYFDPSGTGNRFWISSAKLIADQIQIGGTNLGAANGKFLMSLDDSGNAVWQYPSTLQNGTTKAFVSSGFYVAQNGTGAGGMDSRRNWYFGAPAFSAQGDLVTSNDVTVLGGGLRMVAGQGSLGDFLVVNDTLGNIGFSPGSVTTSSFVIGDKIASGTTQVATVGSDNSIRFTNNGTETARLVDGGYLGINTPSPQAYLDVNGSAFLRGSLGLPGLSPLSNYYLKSMDTAGTAQWAPIVTLDDGIGDSIVINSNTRVITASISNAAVLTLSNTGASFASTVNIGGPLNVQGIVTAAGLSSRSPLPFYVGGATVEVARFLDNGNFGIGITSPAYRLQVAGSQSNTGDIFAQNITATNQLFGSGFNITNINPNNVGTGSNNLTTFQGQTRSDITALQIGISTTNSNIYSTIYGINLTGGSAFYSTLSSQIIITSNALSSQIGPGAAQEISSFSTALGGSLNIVFQGFGSSLSNAFGQISTVSTQTNQYASSIAWGTASTLDQAVFSTIRASLTIGRGPYAIPPPLTALEVNGNLLVNSTGKIWISSGGMAIGYKAGKDISGLLDVSGLIYSRSLRGITAPFGLGVGQSTTAMLNAGSYTPGLGWRWTVQGDIDISGFLFRNGALYGGGGSNIPDFYWAKNGSNIYYGDGNVGIGTPYPSYPLDVAGRIRCWGVDVIPGPGPTVSTSQGPYVSPWLYQSSNIYYNLGGVGVGTGISSVLNGVMMDISGPVRQRWGGVYLGSTLAVGKAYGSDVSGSLDVRGSAYFSSLFVDGTGHFGGQVTAASFLTPSDMRLKDEVSTIHDAERMIHDLRGVRFRWKKSGLHDIGVIAQEVSTIIPEAVYMEDEKMMVSYDKLIPVLLQGFKSLQNRVDQLEKEVVALRRG
jgi:hypothetical protein